MADLVEILMIEHLAMKRMKEKQVTGISNEEFSSFHAFLMNVHVEVEEKIVFPELIEPQWDDQVQYAEKIEKIKADHKLINTLATNLKKWYDGGNIKTYNDRIPLYFRLLVDHNTLEEREVFPRWKDLNKFDESGKLAKECMNIIESYGEGDYLKMLDLSEGAFKYLFRKLI